MSSEAEELAALAPTLEALRALFEADGGELVSVQRERDGAYTLSLGGAYAGSPALDLLARHLLKEAFERALGRPVELHLSRALSPF